MNVLMMKWTDLIKDNPEFNSFSKEIIDLLMWMDITSVGSITALDENALERIRVPFWWVKNYIDNCGFSSHPPGQAQAFYSTLCTGPDIFRLPLGVKHEMSMLRKYFVDFQSTQNPKKGKSNRKPKNAPGSNQNQTALVNNTVPWFIPSRQATPPVNEFYSATTKPTSFAGSWCSQNIKQEIPMSNAVDWSTSRAKQEISNTCDWSSSVKQEFYTNNTSGWCSSPIKQEIAECDWPKPMKQEGPSSSGSWPLIKQENSDPNVDKRFQNGHGPVTWPAHSFSKHQSEE